MTIEQLERLSPGDWFFDVRDQLKWHIYRRAETCFQIGDAQRDSLTSPDGIRERQARLREFFIASIGGLPDDTGAIEPRVTGELKGDGFRIEKLIYESRPGHFVTSLLYLPNDCETPAPAVLFLCGHAVQGKAYPEYQRVCQLLAKTGFIVLAQDPIGQGERLSYWDPRIGGATVGACTLEHDHAGAQCVPLGWSLARFLLHDAMRSLDYLCSRPDVDTRRIGLTGNSGGGTQSCLLMLTDPRIAAAAPGTFIMNRQTYMYSGGAQDAEQIWPGFTAAGYDHEDVLIAMAPRPVCVLAVTDDFFPIEGTRRTVQRCRHIWEAFGVSDQPMLVEDRSDHAYTPTLAMAAARFFAEHLQGRGVEPDYAATTPFPEADVRCTKSGQVRADIPAASAVFESCAARLAALEQARSAQSLADRRQAARDYILHLVRSHRKPCDLNPRTYWSGTVGDLHADARIWWSQPDLMGHGVQFRPMGSDGVGLPTTLAVWDGGTCSLQSHLAWIRKTVGDGRSVLVLDVAGVGALAPHSLLASCAPLEFYGVIHKLADDLTWIGDSLAALRTYDVLRAVDLLVEFDLAPDVRIFADGKAGRECLYGILAAFVDDRVGGLDVEGPLPRFAEWIRDRHYDSRGIKGILLPGVLELFDVDDLV